MLITPAPYPLAAHWSRRIGAAALSLACVVAVVRGDAAGQEPAAQPSVVVHPDGSVSVRAQRASVLALLSTFQTLCTIELQIDAAGARRTVTLELSNVPADYAIAQILKESGLDFSMTACGSPGKPMRIAAGDLSAGGLKAAKGIELPEREAPRIPIETPPPLPPGPPAAPERHDEDEAPASTSHSTNASQRPELGAGQMAGPDLLRALTSGTPSSGALIQLPFGDDTGQVYTQPRPVPGSMATLPFPDEMGQPVTIQVQPIPREHRKPLILLEPAPPVSPAAPPPANPNDGGRRPGGGSDR